MLYKSICLLKAGLSQKGIFGNMGTSLTAKKLGMMKKPATIINSSFFFYYMTF